MLVRGLWGIQIGPQSDQIIKVEASFRITMASIFEFNGPERTSVYIRFQNSTFLLCSLIPEKIEQQVLDITCLQGEEITLRVDGPNVIHLLGNYISQDGIDDQKDNENGYLEINGSNVHEPADAMLEETMPFIKFPAERNGLGFDESDEFDSISESQAESEAESEVESEVESEAESESETMRYYNAARLGSYADGLTTTASSLDTSKDMEDHASPVSSAEGAGRYVLINGNASVRSSTNESVPFDQQSGAVADQASLSNSQDHVTETESEQELENKTENESKQESKQASKQESAHELQQKAQHKQEQEQVLAHEPKKKAEQVSNHEFISKSMSTPEPAQQPTPEPAMKLKSKSGQSTQIDSTDVKSARQKPRKKKLDSIPANTPSPIKKKADKAAKKLAAALAKQQESNGPSSKDRKKQKKARKSKEKKKRKASNNQTNSQHESTEESSQDIQTLVLGAFANMAAAIQSAATVGPAPAPKFEEIKVEDIDQDIIPKVVASSAVKTKGGPHKPKDPATPTVSQNDQTQTLGVNDLVTVPSTQPKKKRKSAKKPDVTQNDAHPVPIDPPAPVPIPIGIPTVSPVAIDVPRLKTSSPAPGDKPLRARYPRKAVGTDSMQKLAMLAQEDARSAEAVRNRRKKLKKYQRADEAVVKKARLSIE